MKKSLVYLSVFAITILPGFAIFFYHIVTPSIQYLSLFGYITLISSLFFVSFLLNNRDRLRSASPGKINRMAIIAIATSVISFITYYCIYNTCVIDYKNYGRVFFPLFPNNELSAAIENAHGKLEFIDSYLGDGSNNKIRKLAASQLLLTAILMLISWIFAIVPIVIISLIHILRMGMHWDFRIIRIFLASSDELKDERMQMHVFLNTENIALQEKKIFLRLVNWENLGDAVTKSGLQDKYNNTI